MEQSTAPVLNSLDILIAGAILFGMFWGSKKGIFNLSNRILSIVLSVLITFRTWQIIERIYVSYFAISDQWRPILSFATAFIILYILISSVLGYLTTGLGKVNVKLDNALGAIFGGLGATLVVSVALIILNQVNFPSQTNKSESILYPYVKGFAPYAVGFGADALRGATRQINKYGLGAPPRSPNTPNTPAPAPAEKPKSIR